MIKTPDDFDAFVKEVEARDGYRRSLAFGIGLAHQSSDGTILDTFFPYPNLSKNFGSAAVLAHAVGHTAGTASYVLDHTAISVVRSLFTPFEDDGKWHGNIEALKFLKCACANFNDENEDVKKVLVVSFIDDPEHDTGPQTTSDAYLRLHLLSLRKVRPNEIKLDGIFGILPNVAWTNEGPISFDDLPKRHLTALASRHPIHVHSVDKFPRMADYVVPPGVRIADTSRVRLGAYLGMGTTVMHEGFCNFNAGTLGASMVEGRISSGVVVGDQTDIGGGASIMGTLSGGGKERIVLGRGCLMGANSGTGISLGDKCVIEAGLYVTAGMPVTYHGVQVKASSLSGKHGLTFRRNGLTGQVEALDRPNDVVLNEELHKN